MRVPATAVAVLGGAAVVVVPFVARHVDIGADEFSGRSFAFTPALGWFVIAVLTAIVVTHRLQIIFSVEEGPVFAVAYDMLPIILMAAPVIALLALVTGHQLLAATAAVLTAYYAALVVPRALSDRVPAWARSAPALRLAVANVYVDNPTPQAAADQLVRCGADVVVIAEATPAFMKVFADAGGEATYPHCVRDPNDESDYAVAVVSRIELEPGSEMVEIGPLALAVAKVDIGGVVTTVAALNPQATFDPGGHDLWKEQIAALTSFVPTVRGPLVIAGDLNTTMYRPEFQELLDAGLTDCIDALGQAWKPSFSLRSVWPLGALGLIIRLDHALGNEFVRARRVRNLRARGSDHLPFVIDLAVRNPA